MRGIASCEDLGKKPAQGKVGNDESQRIVTEDPDAVTSGKEAAHNLS